MASDERFPARHGRQTEDRRYALRHVVKSMPDAQRTPGPSRPINQQRRVFARVIRAAESRIVAMVGGDNEPVV